MIKIYFVCAVVYAFIKLGKSEEVEWVRIVGEWLKHFLLFPLAFIKDIVEVLTRSAEIVDETEPKKR